MIKLKTILEEISADEFKKYKLDPSKAKENSDGTIDYDGDVEFKGGMFGGKIDKIPFKFGKVTGNFTVYNNKITTLENAPKEVTGNFIVTNNKLLNLKGAPEKVGGDFDCSHNSLTTLDGATDNIPGNFKCTDNKLTNLVGGPTNIGGNYDASNNKISTVENGPKKIGGMFNLQPGRGFSDLPGTGNKIVKSVDVGGEIYYHPVHHDISTKVGLKHNWEKQKEKSSSSSSQDSMRRSTVTPSTFRR